MKDYSVRLSFTDRRQGPGTGITMIVKASAIHTAMKHATRRFWDTLTHKQKRDVRRNGLRVDLREISVDKTPKA